MSDQIGNSIYSSAVGLKYEQECTVRILYVATTCNRLTVEMHANDWSPPANTRVRRPVTLSSATAALSATMALSCDSVRGRLTMETLGHTLSLSTSEGARRDNGSEWK